MIKLYAVVDSDGDLVYRKFGPMIFDSESQAKNRARDDGDSVVEVEVDLSKEPIFIRRKVVNAG